MQKNISEFPKEYISADTICSDIVGKGCEDWESCRLLTEALEERNCAILLNYLHGILHDPHARALDLDILDEPFRALGHGLRFLQTVMEEMLAYCDELSKGNLSVQAPNMDNLLCANLKQVHATLNQVTRQTKQAGEGDYSRQAPHLGEFSAAFNMMVAQMEEREEKLHREAETVAQRSRSLSDYNDLLLKMAANRAEWILVVDAETKRVLCCNRQSLADASLEVSPCGSCTRQHPGLEEVFQWSGNENQVWHLHLASEEYYQVKSYPVEWKGRSAYVHVVADVSREAWERKILSNKAYRDPVTGLYNRVYFEEYMSRILADGRPVTLGYLDMDGLKEINDYLGHQEGDRYLAAFGRLLKDNFRSGDLIARIGGDEFCVAMEGELEEVTRKKLEAARASLLERSTGEYPLRFSFGVCQVSGNETRRLKDILREADQRMYADKRARKQTRGA
jgi:diguanylate cyclase (GGDEF)-like protein